jgi:hypothetical protein
MPGKRNYLPTLRAILHTSSRYVTRYQPQLTAAMTPTQVLAFVSFIGCLIDLIQALGAEEVGP